jgi:hypothetical protein
VTDRRSVIKGLFGAIPGAVVIENTAMLPTQPPVSISEKEVAVEKKTLIVFKLNTRVPHETQCRLVETIREYLKAVGVTQPAILLPCEIDVTTLEVSA